MILTLWRHGEAESNRSDEQRALSRLGHTHARLTAESYERWRSNAGVGSVTAVFFSPYRRTRETAELLSSVFQPDTSEALDTLAPGAQLDNFTEEQFEMDQHIVMVSHQPFVSSAIAYWADDRTLTPLAPGGYSALEVLSLQRGGATTLRHCPEPRALMDEGCV